MVESSQAATSNLQVLIPSLLTLGGVVVGTVSTIVAERMRDRSAHEREREAREEARRDKYIEKRNDEQRELLLRLQDAILMLGAAASSAHAQDSRLPTEGESWHYNHRHDEINAKHSQAQAQSTVLVVRVRDEQVRSMVQGLKVECVLVMNAKSAEQSNKAMGDALQLFNAVNDRIGQLLRKDES